MKEILRWIALPITFFLAKPAASLFMWFQSWFASPDSFFVTKISPLIAFALTGYLLVYFAYEIAPRAKIVAVSVYFGILITLVIISYLLVGTLDVEAILTTVGLILGFIQILVEEKDKKSSDNNISDPNY